MTASEIVTHVERDGIAVIGVVVRFGGYQCELIYAEDKWHAGTVGEGVDGEPVLIVASEWTARQALEKVTEWRKRLDLGEFNDEDDYPW